MFAAKHSTKYRSLVSEGVADTEPSSDRVWRGYEGRLMVAVSIGWFAIRLGREAIPPLLPTIIEAVEISPSDAGFGLTLMWLIYALSQYPGGRLSDGLSRKTVLVASLSTLLTGFLILSVITTYVGLLVGFMFVGVGAGLYYAPSRALLAALFISKRGQVFGIQAAAGSIGAASAAGVTVLALSIGHWQLAFLPVLITISCVLAAIHYWQRGGYVVEPVSLSIQSTARRILKIPQIRWLLVAYVLVSFSWQGFLGFLPTFLQVDKELSPVLASTAYALVFVTAIIIGPTAGKLADIVSRILVAMLGVSLAVLGLVTILLASQAVVLVLGVVLFAVGLRAYPPVMQAHLMGLFPDESMAGDFGGSKTIWTGIGSFAPTYVGVVAARSSYGMAFSGFIICLFVGFFILVYIYATEAD